MVAAAHLKPLNRGDHINNITEKIIHPWNPSARGRTENHSVATELNIIPQKVLPVYTAFFDICDDIKHRHSILLAGNWKSHPITHQLLATQCKLPFFI